MPDRNVGRARRRREDRARVTGAARYTDDVHPTDAVHAAILRCPYGHARIDRVDVDPAADQSGVITALGAAELRAAGGPSGVPTTNYFPGSDTFERPLLVDTRARYAGEPVVIVLAEDRYAAHQALDSIDVDYERLPAVTDPREAATTDKPSISDERSDTVEWTVGDEEAVERAIERADHTVDLDLSNQRLLSASMEPRSVLAEYGRQSSHGDSRPDAESGADVLTVTTSTQTPHSDRTRIAETLDLPERRVRVVTPAVGGGFGPKGARPYPEEPLVAWCAMRLSRPVKWIATRSEANQTDHQGRDVHVSAELGLGTEGDIRAVRMRGYVGIGGYPVRGPSSCLKPQLLSGAYEIPAIQCRVTGALTNTTPLGPYRGTGRPEPIFVLERLIDRAAAELDIDPAVLRRRNFVPPDAFPYETPLGYTYDSGSYETALDRALDAVGYEERRRDQELSRWEGRHLGVGIASFVEHTGSLTVETGRVEIDASGAVTAYCGTTDQGQGHRTTFSQLLADELGVPYEDVTIVEGDTDDLDDGTGTFGSRSVPVGASALVKCADRVLDRAKSIAARHLEVARADVDFSDGRFAVRGAPDRGVALAAVAEAAGAAEAESESGFDGADPPALAATVTYEPEGYAFSFGTHVAVVAVDTETGDVDVERYVAVDDCGVQVNPTLVEGQIHGGVAQGVGQALTEAVRYGTDGTLLTPSLRDYAVPRATDVPEIDTASTVTPSPLTPHGAKGVGEAGAIAAPPAVVNAVVDALRPFDVEHVDMPLTPETVWQAASDTPDGG